MPGEHILLLLSDPQAGQWLEKAALQPAGYRVTYASQRSAAVAILNGDPPDLVILSATLDGAPSADLANRLFQEHPLTPVVLLTENPSPELALQAFRQGFAECMQPPLNAIQVQQIIHRLLGRQQSWKEQVRQIASRDTYLLRSRINVLEEIEQVGRKVTSLLDLDSLLASVVDSAVKLTGAEEGSLLLLDETSGELYMRAARNFQEEFVRTFRLPTRDTLAGQVVRSRQPLLIDADTPQKIKTSYLVHTLVYVPLISQGRVLGVLEVDNRQSRKPFTSEQVTLLSMLADYAAIAVENANLFSRSEVERAKLETILKDIEESVIIVDHDRRLLLINRKARQAFGVTEQNVTGMRLREVISHQELLDILRESAAGLPARVELTLEDGRVLNAQLTQIPDIGLVITMQDITHLKELDRIKSDFVHTVSHDLRSPLTAILGYVELIERVGPTTQQQKDFIQRVQISVHNITSLINDLLDLGRIEAGFDTRKEVVSLTSIVQYAADGLVGRANEKSLQLAIAMPDNLPAVLGNPVRLRQMLSNLISNAIKFTPPGGKITVTSRAEAGQVIIQVSDTGPGIPNADQPYIFDKFYRGSNTPIDMPGTGLGLAIVRSIVENHMGRIWVESTPGQGATFTVVLPTIDQNL